ncbi:MAG: hypothetical protein JNG89_06115 [Planctomycetaceae bacterium]|nr:hypothetical protein [Planctomycetaceae bacterium]
MRRCLSTELTASILILLMYAPWLSAQTADQELAAQPAATESTLDIVIPDEPRTIDPATLVPERLAQPATVEFADASLSEVVQWLRNEQTINTIVEDRILEEGNVSLAEPVTDRLDNQPVYLLLNRLRSIEVAWTFREGVLRLTTQEAADNDVVTKPYPVGDLFDAGYDPDQLTNAVESSTEAAWEGIDGIGGSIQILGDVLFVENTDAVHRKVSGLLSALRQHGRRTFVFDEPAHITMRDQLAGKTTVNFENVPLAHVLDELAVQSGLDIRMDGAALRENKIREREPVSVTLTDQPLRLVLESILSPLNLNWLLRDRVVWITTQDVADDANKAAVFDVRDLCRDTAESDALLDAITSQTSGRWQDTTGDGGSIDFPRDGTMVVLNTEDQLDSVLQLLENYRLALRSSKRRARPGEDPNEVITRYYRLQTRIADDVASALPMLVQLGTWRDGDHPDAQGSIQQLASGTSLLDAQGKSVVAAAEDEKPTGGAVIVVEHSVLIVRQTRAAHDEIEELISKIEHGDQPETGGLGGGGFGGGGFGGGFFSTPKETAPE